MQWQSGLLELQLAEIKFFSGYHGWYDWYLSANIGDNSGLDGQLMPGLDPAGVPRSLKNTSIPFQFNDIAELKSKASGIEHEIAAIIVEPARGGRRT